MTKSRQQLTDRLVELFRQVRLGSAPPGEWSQTELTMVQLRTIVMLSERPKRMTEIASHAGTSLPSATSIIDRLVSKGLVERQPDPHDRRVVSCALSAAGQEEVERIWRMGRQQIELAAEMLTTEEMEAVVKGMAILAEAVSRRVAAPVENGDRLPAKAG